MESPWLRGTPTIAAYVRAHEKTVLEWLRRGKLRGHQPSGAHGTWYVHRANADAFLMGVAQKVRLAS